MFQRVLVCTDFHDGVQRLLQFIPELAASGIQHLMFLHCVPLWEEGEIPRANQSVIDRAEQRFQAALADLGSPDILNIEVTFEVRSGAPDENIMQVADRFQADVLILGATTRNFLTEKLFGSTTAKLANRMRRPLLTLRPQLISTYTGAELALRCQHLFRCLLVPFDGSAAAQYLIEYLTQQVGDFCHYQNGGALSCPEAFQQCHLVWIQDDAVRRVPHSYRQEEAETQLAQAQQALETIGLTVTTEIRQGEPLQQLLDVATERDISAIAVSSRRANALLDWSIPSFSNEVMRRSWHPVLFIPPQL
ncbi:MAG: universal stress protein [Prochlorothrix sp.]